MLQLVTYALAAAVLTVGWSLADRKCAAYPRLHAFMLLYTRFYLATMLLAYGSAKVFPYQFRPPSLARLLQPVGDYDPQALMWVFFGSSTAYTMFAGAMEMFAGLLLLVPRLTTLGALVSLATLTNVFALDMSYDVDVRTFCFLLMLTCCFLLAPYLRRLADALVFNRRIDAAPARPLFQSRRVNQIAGVLQILSAVCIVGYALVVAPRYAHERDQALSRNPLRGIWAAEEFTLDGEVRQALVTDSVRWQRVVIDTPAGYEDKASDLVTIQSMQGSLYSVEGLFDLERGSLELAKVSGDPNWRAHFALARPHPDELLLDGSYDGRQLHLRLRLMHPYFKLTAARFRWPNAKSPLPFNP